MKAKIIFSFLIGVMVGILITFVPAAIIVEKIANVSIPSAVVIFTNVLLVFAYGVMITTGVGRLLSGLIVIPLFLEWEQRHTRAIVINSVMILCAIGLLFFMKGYYYTTEPTDFFTAFFAVKEYLSLTAVLLINLFGSVVGIILINKIPLLRSFVLL